MLGKLSHLFRSASMHVSAYTRAELARVAQYPRIPPMGTLVLCSLVMGLFLVQMGTGGRQWSQAYGAVPVNIDHLSSLLQTGKGQSVPAWLTLFTYMFVHACWFHVLSNAAAVWIIGTIAELRLGTPGFLLAYLAGGVSGAFGLALVSPQGVVPAQGASLAFCYVVGAYWGILALDTLRRNGRTVLCLSLETAAVLLIVWRLTLPAGFACERGIIYHILPAAFGWFSIRIGTGFIRLWPIRRNSLWHPRLEKEHDSATTGTCT